MSRTDEELKLIQSYLSPSTSESMEYFSIDFDKLTNEQIKFVISDWLPNQIIKVGPYYIYYLRKDINPELWDELVDVILSYAYKQACRQMINKDYMEEQMKKSNLLVLCFLKNIDEDLEIDMLQGIFVAHYGKVDDEEYILNKDEGFIVSTCFVEIRNLKIKLGLFMRCLGLSILKNLKVKHIYTEALNKDLVKYYDTLGFRIFIPDGIDSLQQYPKRKLLKCNDKFVIEEIDKIYKSKNNNIQNIIEFFDENDDETQKRHWYMSICNFDETEICFRSFESLRNELNKINSFYDEEKEILKLTKLIDKLIISESLEDVHNYLPLIINMFKKLKVYWFKNLKTYENFEKLLYKYIIEYGIDENIRWYNQNYKLYLNELFYNYALEYGRNEITDEIVAGGRIDEEDSEDTFTEDYIEKFWKTMNKEDKRKLKIFIKNSNDSRLIFNYIEYMLGKRWKEIESKLIKIFNTEQLQNYIINYIKDRWIEAEDKLMKDPNGYSVNYAINILGRRWLEMEPYIYKNRNKYPTDMFLESYLKHFNITEDELKKN